MKVTIVGAGAVGASCAEYIAIKDFADEVVLIDIKEGFAEGKAMDLMQCSSLNGFDSAITGTTGDYTKTANSDVAVITSGIPRKPGMTREELISTNAGIVKNVVEKPAQKDAPSNQAIIGKYICTSDIWNALENATTSEGGEIRLIDGFEQLLKNGTLVSSCSIEGERFDAGNIKELFFANLYRAIRSGEVSKDEVLEIMKML